jgi:16S rRNA (guanine966-N2)-methyltransferase
MRIIAGEHGGRRLVTPKGDRTRPTSDRAREGLYSSLQTLIDLDGAQVLDLFAGSGALGFEAVSRGAAGATFVDDDAGALAALRANAAALGCPAAVVDADVRSFLQREPSPYQLVLCDPPYDTEVEPVLALLEPWVLPGGVVVVERRTRGPKPQAPGWLEEVRSRRYGEATLWYFRAAERGDDHPGR